MLVRSEAPEAHAASLGPAFSPPNCSIGGHNWYGLCSLSTKNVADVRAAHEGSGFASGTHLVPSQLQLKALSRSIVTSQILCMAIQIGEKPCSGIQKSKIPCPHDCSGGGLRKQNS